MTSPPLAASPTDLYLGGDFLQAGGKGPVYVARAQSLVAEDSTSTRAPGAALKIPISEVAGDLYGYLSYNGVSVPLLNRVGVGTGNSAGYSDSGMSVTFSDDAANNFHFYRSVEDFSITGGAQWQPDGRAISPLSTPASFDAAGTVSLSAFDGMNPNGNWTLVMADVSGGGGQTTVTSWGLTVVPEPAHMGLVFALGLLAVPLTKKWLTRTARSSAGSIAD